MPEFVAGSVLPVIGEAKAEAFAAPSAKEASVGAWKTTRQSMSLLTVAKLCACLPMTILRRDFMPGRSCLSRRPSDA